jgi:serine phosphatase RsbU (regulator of sigma subunit)
MEVQIAVSKVKKYATSSSGDTVEVIERPQGGLSVVMADGQSSGRGAKWISTMVVRKVISLLAEGVRDGAAARAASDYLFTERSGKVSATLNILSVDMHTRTLVITRNNPAAVLLIQAGELIRLQASSSPIGIYRDTRPQINQVDLETGMVAVAFTDGIVHAGSRYGKSMDPERTLTAILEAGEPTSQEIADALLMEAMELDHGRPVDDISVVVMRVSAREEDQIRRMSVNLPLGY